MATPPLPDVATEFEDPLFAWVVLNRVRLIMRAGAGPPIAAHEPRPRRAFHW